MSATFRLGWEQTVGRQGSSDRDTSKKVHFPGPSCKSGTHPICSAARCEPPTELLGQVERLLDVYQTQGDAYLGTYRIPLLTWEEVKALKGPDTVGLGLGSEGAHQG